MFAVAVVNFRAYTVGFSFERESNVRIDLPMSWEDEAVFERIILIGRNVEVRSIDSMPDT